MDGNRKWQFWIDSGGTFTDIVALRPDGRFETAKLLSENPELYSDAATEAISRILQSWKQSGHTNMTVAAVKMGTTIATNALLERKGEPTALIVTRGFADSLSIGYQHRPDIFALNIVKPAPLYDCVIEIDERVDTAGEVLIELDEPAISTALQSCVASGIRCAAICFMHGYRYPAHEIRVAALARLAGFTQISISHQTEAVIKFISRA